MTATLSDVQVGRHEDVSSPLELSDGQVSAICSAASSALGEVSVQFRHATPFTPIRRQLREVSCALRSVLNDHAVTAELAPTVAEVLAERAAHLATQRRHCASLGFARQLRAEEEQLRALVEVLHDC